MASRIKRIAQKNREGIFFGADRPDTLIKTGRIAEGGNRAIASRIAEGGNRATASRIAEGGKNQKKFVFIFWLGYGSWGTGMNRVKKVRG